MIKYMVALAFILAISYFQLGENMIQTQKENTTKISSDYKLKNSKL